MASRSGQISRSGPEKSAHISPDHAPGHLAEISGATNIHPVSRFPDPCFLIEPDTGRILDFNTLALELLGYEPEELLAKTIFDLKFGLSREEFRSYVDQTGDRLFTALPLSQLLRRDGSSVSVELNLGLTTADGFRAILIVARDITERERAEQERAVIAEIGRIISSSLDINDIYARFVNALHEILESDRTVIAEVDVERRTLTPAYIDGIIVPGSGEGVEQELDNSLLGQVVDTREPLLFDRQSSEMLALDYHDLAVRAAVNLYSHMVVPLISNDEVIGMFTVSSTRDSCYDERDLSLAQQVAAQISGAVAASRLYARTRKNLKEKEVLAEIGRVMGESLDIDVVYDRFAQSIKKLFDFDRITVSEFDIESNTTTPLYVAGLEVEGWEAGSVHPVEVTQLGPVFLDRLPLLLSTQSVETHFLKHGPAAAGATAGLRSGMAVPLIIRDQVLGALNLSSFQQDAYTEEGLELLERVGQQIANAISNARLFAATSRDGRERAAIAAVGLAVNSDLDLDAIYARVDAEIAGLIDYDRIAISLISDSDRKVQELVYVSGVKAPGFEEGDRIPNRHTPGREWGWLRFREDTLSDGKKNGEISSLGLRSRIVATLGSPDSGPLGYISLRSYKPNAYQDADLDLLEQIAVQITPAIVNAQLLDQVRMEARDREVIAEIGRAVGSSLDISDVWQSLDEQIRLVLPCDRFVIVELDPTENALVAVYQTGVSLQGIDVGESQRLTETEWKFFSQQIGIIRLDRSQMEEQASSIQSIKKRLDAGLCSHVSVPIVVDGRILGRLGISSSLDNAYTVSDADLLLRIATQVAPAFVNSQLHQQTIQLGNEQAAIATIGATISSTLDIDDVYEEVATQLQELVPFDRFVVSTVDRERNEVVGSYVAGLSVPGFEPGRSRPLAELPKDSVLFTGTPRLTSPAETRRIAATVSTEALALSYGLLSQMAIPLSSGGEIIGYMTLRSKSETGYTTNDLQIAQRIAEQITPAIKNAQLLTQIRGAAAQEERTRISRDIHDSVAQGLSGLLWQIDEIEDSIKTDPSEALGLIEKARHAATSSLLDTRRAVWGLRPGELGGRGLPDALRRETERIALEGRLNWEFNSTGKLVELMPQLELALLRVGQEAVYNTVRHADANAITMALKWSAHFVELVITDDGVGFDVEEASGATDSAHGLHAMKERAQENGATLEIRSTPGTGTTVTMKVPYQR